MQTKNLKALLVGLLLSTVAVLTLPVLTGHPPAHAAGNQFAENAHKQFSTTEVLNTDIIGTALNPGKTGDSALAYRITVGVETTSVFNCQMDTVAGVGAVEFDFNDGTALTAGRWYTFTIGVNSAFTYDFQVETGGDVTLIIDEVYGGKL